MYYIYINVYDIHVYNVYNMPRVFVGRALFCLGPSGDDGTKMWPAETELRTINVEIRTPQGTAARQREQIDPFTYTVYCLHVSYSVSAL